MHALPSPVSWIRGAALLSFVALALACRPAADESSVPDSAAGTEDGEDEDEAELEEERPPGQGSCCKDDRCKFSEYPGRREWAQGCREQEADMGQWCPGECTLDVDSRPPRCVCL